MEEPKNILVLVDGSEAADHAFGKALQFIKGEGNESNTLTVCSVVSLWSHQAWSPGLKYGQLGREAVEKADEWHSRIAKRLVKSYVKYCHRHHVGASKHVTGCVITPETILQSPAEAALDYVNRHHITDIFMGTRGLSFSRGKEKDADIMGTFSDYVSRHAKCGVHIIKGAPAAALPGSKPPPDEEKEAAHPAKGAKVELVGLESQGEGSDVYLDLNPDLDLDVADIAATAVDTALDPAAQRMQALQL